jgi:hypothetical protein
MTERDRIKQAALIWANRVRLQRGKPRLEELPKGQSGPYTCPLAVATGLPMTYGIRPKAAVDFMAWFDTGEFPELVEAA